MKKKIKSKICRNKYVFGNISKNIYLCKYFSSPARHKNNWFRFQHILFMLRIFSYSYKFYFLTYRNPFFRKKYLINNAEEVFFFLNIINKTLTQSHIHRNVYIMNKLLVRLVCMYVHMKITIIFDFSFIKIK